MTLNELRDIIYSDAVKKGWYDIPRSFGDVISLIHAELSEALEEYRNGNEVNEIYYKAVVTQQPYVIQSQEEVFESEEKHIPAKPEGIPIELADVIIRVLDICGEYGIDIEKAVQEKIEYNKTRQYRHGNKKI